MFSNDPLVSIDKSADIWSLAMVIAEILSGDVPYDSQEVEVVLFHLLCNNCVSSIYYFTFVSYKYNESFFDNAVQNDELGQVY